ncbi:MAG: phage major tail tube protein, partial [Clostridiales bacterium]|nr:phage major tail tube protein [Clostridiales bacterium]
FSGAGVGGEINVPAHGMMQPRPVAISIPHIYDKAVRFFQLGVGTITLDLRRDLAVTNPDTHAIENVPDRWVIKGPITKSDPGKAEQKASSDASVEIQAYYCQHFLDGDEILQWDPFTPIHKVNGVDLLAEMKANIGL